ncbi:MAG: DUF423 domain-containing protein [Arenicellales bacterium WSBS_2016_MAG_OTU3]
MAIAVTLGAFGAHALKARLTPEMLNVFETGNRYHFYHALGLLVVGVLAHFYPDSNSIKNAGWIMLLGIFLFCGSLYWLAIGAPKWVGPVTPLGGLAFIVAWIMLAVGVFKSSPL